MACIADLSVNVCCVRGHHKIHPAQLPSQPNCLFGPTALSAQLPFRPTYLASPPALSACLLCFMPTESACCCRMDFCLEQSTSLRYLQLDHLQTHYLDYRPSFRRACRKLPRCQFNKNFFSLSLKVGQNKLTCLSLASLIFVSKAIAYPLCRHFVRLLERPDSEERLWCRSVKIVQKPYQSGTINVPYFQASLKA